MDLARFGLKGKTAFITGGGRGIRARIAEGMSNVGARVVVTARSRTEIDEVAAKINAAGGQGHAFGRDVTDRTQIERVVAEVERDVGPIDILVNNAGGGSPIVTLMEISDADWDPRSPRTSSPR